jgi:hypothetical protein
VVVLDLAGSKQLTIIAINLGLPHTHLGLNVKGVAGMKMTLVIIITVEEGFSCVTIGLIHFPVS